VNKMLQKGQKQLDKQKMYLVWQKNLAYNVGVAIEHYQKFPNCECEVCKKLNSFEIRVTKN
jgi:hypothetical protein